jgi:hypothetical protein
MATDPSAFDSLISVLGGSGTVEAFHAMDTAVSYMSMDLETVSFSRDRLFSIFESGKGQGTYQWGLSLEPSIAARRDCVAK